MGVFLGIDTSNYCTSAALYGDAEVSERQLLSVPEGTLGLRQSDAVFQHIKTLPVLLERLFETPCALTAVGVSVRPRDVAGSYMPCFLAGESIARSIAASHNIPLYTFSHQMGHLAAGAWSAGRRDLLHKPCLVWHVSGGTTELLHYDGHTARKIGGTTDLNAGQLIDRIGVSLGLGFPAGPALEALADTSEQRVLRGAPTVHDLQFSLSGLQNKAEKLLSDGVSHADIAFSVLHWIGESILNTTEAARQEYGDIPVLCVGGVFNNKMLCKSMCSRFDAITAQNGFSGDNAMGIALLASGGLENIM